MSSPLRPAHEAAGAIFTSLDGFELPAHFTGGKEIAALRSGAGLADRGFAGVVRLAGPDARRFCNGMFTNNIRDLAPGGGNRSAMVDDKARIQGLLDVYCLAPDAFLAVLDGVSPEAFEARYGKYIIFDDVELEDNSAGLYVLALQGPQAEDVLGAVGISVPGAVHAGDDALRVARSRRCAEGGFDLVVRREGALSLWARLAAAGAVPVGLDAQELARIEAGIARWPVDMGERALLHEMRLVESCGSFNKGCYIGQEVINRIDVMGQVAKKIWGVEGEGEPPSPGTEVRVGDEPVGTSLSVARDGGRWRGLALLRRSAWTPGLEVRLGERSAVVHDLPFGP